MFWKYISSGKYQKGNQLRDGEASRRLKFMIHFREYDLRIRGWWKRRRFIRRNGAIKQSSVSQSVNNISISSIFSTQ
jgi:hypothetical protein